MLSFTHNLNLAPLLKTIIMFYVVENQNYELSFVLDFHVPSIKNIPSQFRTDCQDFIGVKVNQSTNKMKTKSPALNIENWIIFFSSFVCLNENTKKMYNIMIFFFWKEKWNLFFFIFFMIIIIFMTHANYFNFFLI